MNLKAFLALWVLLAAVAPRIRFFPARAPRRLSLPEEQADPRGEAAERSDAQAEAEAEDGAEDEPKSFQDYQDTADKSIEFQKIKEEFQRKNPVEVSDKTEAQLKKEELEKIQKRKDELEKLRARDPMVEDLPEKPPKVVRYPNEEIEAMVANSENAACNRRLLFSYLDSMTDDTYYANPRPANSFNRKTCPGMDRTCCMDEHFEELVRFFRAGTAQLDDIEVILRTFLKTIELLNVEDVEEFSKSQELLNQNKCVGLPDLSILVKYVEQLKENLNVMTKVVAEYFQFYREYFSGFVCHYCSVDAERHFVFQSKGTAGDRVEVLLKRTSCKQVFAREVALFGFMKEFLKFLQLTRAIRCEQRDPSAEKMTIPQESKFVSKIDALQDCMAAPLDSPDWKGDCKISCKKYHTFTHLILSPILTNNIVDAILTVKKKFNLSVLAPKDLLAYSFLDNIVTIYKVRKDSDFSLDSNYNLNITETGLTMTSRQMNLTYVNWAGALGAAATLLIGLLF